MLQCCMRIASFTLPPFEASKGASSKEHLLFRLFHFFSLNKFSTNAEIRPFASSKGLFLTNSQHSALLKTAFRISRLRFSSLTASFKCSRNQESKRSMFSSSPQIALRTFCFTKRAIAGDLPSVDIAIVKSPLRTIAGKKTSPFCASVSYTHLTLPTNREV